ncbi:MAG: YabP/YqfC family sporulation protein [Bacillota bacterium]
MSLFKNKFSSIFELPEEVLMDFPLIMLVGSSKLYIENHKGISLYQPDLIKIRITPGLFILHGSEMEIDELESNKLFISGQITEFKIKQVD